MDQDKTNHITVKFDFSERIFLQGHRLKFTSGLMNSRMNLTLKVLISFDLVERLFEHSEHSPTIFRSCFLDSKQTKNSVFFRLIVAVGDLKIKS